MGDLGLFWGILDHRQGPLQHYSSRLSLGIRRSSFGVLSSKWWVSMVVKWACSTVVVGLGADSLLPATPRPRRCSRPAQRLKIDLLPKIHVLL